LHDVIRACASAEDRGGLAANAVATAIAEATERGRGGVH
jgi:hypothetical protein